MKTYHIITIGCQMNKSDSERVSGLFSKKGWKETDNKYQADIVVVNTCGIRQSAEDRIYGLIPGIKKKNGNVKIIFTGCLINRKDVRRRLMDSVDFWIPISEFHKFKFKTLEQKSGNCDYLKLKPKYNSKFSAFVPIGNGCDNYCTYCVVPYARGRETYRKADEIIKEVKNLIKNGYKEITLIAQNVNSYKDKKTNFAKLLKQASKISGDFWIRFVTSHPKDMSQELINVIAGSEKICKHIHLPAQSGDNEILKKMNRKYTVEHYNKLIGLIRNKINTKKRQSKGLPPVSITTDIIVGFPGETRKQYANTQRLFKKDNFDMAYIAQFSSRPGTAAAKMDDSVTRKEKKDREVKLDKILRQTAHKNNKNYLGKNIKVLVQEKNRQNKYFGYTETMKNVSFDSKNKKIKPGDFITVKITAAKDFGLSGKII